MAKSRTITVTKQRNWPAYGLYRKDEEMLFLERAKQVVWSIDTPWEPKSVGENGGRPAFHTRTKVMCLLKEKFGFDYRSLESHLRARPDLLKIMEIEKAPSKSVIHDEGVKRIPERYLKKVNGMLVEPLESKKGI